VVHEQRAQLAAALHHQLQAAAGELGAVADGQALQVRRVGRQRLYVLVVDEQHAPQVHHAQVGRERLQLLDGHRLVHLLLFVLDFLVRS